MHIFVVESIHDQFKQKPTPALKLVSHQMISVCLLIHLMSMIYGQTRLSGEKDMFVRNRGRQRYCVVSENTGGVGPLCLLTVTDIRDNGQQAPALPVPARFPAPITSNRKKAKITILVQLDLIFLQLGH